MIDNRTKTYSVPGWGVPSCNHRPAGYKQPLWHSPCPLSYSFHQEGCRAQGTGSVSLLHPRGTDAKAKMVTDIIIIIIIMYTILYFLYYMKKTKKNNNIQYNSSSDMHDQCIKTVENINLLDSICPSLFNTLSGPHIVIILCQQVNHFRIGWAQNKVTQVYWGRSKTTRLLIPKKKKKKKKMGMSRSRLEMIFKKYCKMSSYYIGMLLQYSWFRYSHVVQCPILTHWTTHTFSYVKQNAKKYEYTLYKNTYLEASLTYLTLSSAWSSVKPIWKPRASKVLQIKNKHSLIMSNTD